MARGVAGAFTPDDTGTYNLEIVQAAWKATEPYRPNRKCAACGRGECDNCDPEDKELLEQLLDAQFCAWVESLPKRLAPLLVGMTDVDAIREKLAPALWEIANHLGGALGIPGGGAAVRAAGIVEGLERERTAELSEHPGPTRSAPMPCSAAGDVFHPICHWKGGSYSQRAGAERPQPDLSDFAQRTELATASHLIRRRSTALLGLASAGS